MLRQVVVPAHQGKLKPNWEGSYHMFQKLPNEPYKLEKLDG